MPSNIFPNPSPECRLRSARRAPHPIRSVCPNWYCCGTVEALLWHRTGSVLVLCSYCASAVTCTALVLYLVLSGGALAPVQSSWSLVLVHCGCTSNRRPMQPAPVQDQCKATTLPRLVQIRAPHAQFGAKLRKRPAPKQIPRNRAPEGAVGSGPKCRARGLRNPAPKRGA